MCGGSSRINIAQDTTWKQSMFTIQQSGKWNFTDCYVDSTASRLLNVSLSVSSSKFTVENCLAACAGKNLAYCGVEYGGECFGALALNSSATIAPSTTSSTDPLSRGCSMPCAANSTEACGGSSRLNVYKFMSNQASVTPSTYQLASKK
jgi:hypothetical protein